jgi:glycosyltransferase involved in cell wall biosynthesis
MTIKLSILIPAYNYLEGMQKILSSVLSYTTTEVEVIISDDSSRDEIRRLVNEYSAVFPGTLIYRRNKAPLGAVHNWNSLLEMATGQYVMLLHHDEYPINNNFIQDAIDRINHYAKYIDVFVLDCILVSEDKRTVRPHLPNFIRRFVLKYYPSYLFKRNVLGPTSCLIVRRTLYPRFDVSLRWLVDVDVYFQLRIATARWIFCNNLKICSMLGRKDSITASIKKDLWELNKRERKYLKLKYPNVHLWLFPDKYWIFGKLESIVWMGMRGLTRLYYALFNFSRIGSQVDYKFFTKIKK